MTCDAEQRINRALFAITLQRGNGVWCLGSIENILTGPVCECKPETADN